MTDWCSMRNAGRLSGVTGVVAMAMIGLALVAGATVVRAATPIPQGLGEAQWGMTIDELRGVVDVTKINPNDPFSYADHLEEEPVIYVGQTAAGQRVEYYFFNGELYKIYLIHGDVQRDLVLYQQLADRLAVAFGPPDRHYDEVVMGLTIIHTIWEDAISSLDLRFGAGFVFQVHRDRSRAEAKALAMKRKKSI